jgi:CRP-like cAMP-binding protein
MLGARNRADREPQWIESLHAGRRGQDLKESEFGDLLNRQPERALRLLASTSQHLRELVGRVEDLTLKDVETHLAHWLVKRCPDSESSQPHEIHLPMAKRVLAAESGP